MKPVYKIGLSLFLLFHLTAIIVLPNAGSVLTHSLPRIFSSYAATLGLQTAWRFFAPNPGIHRYLEIELIPADQSAEVTTVFWPPQDRGEFFAANFSRRFYHSIKSTMSPQRVEKYFKPWLCRQYPEAERFTMKVVSFSVPHIEKTRLQEGVDSFQDVEQEVGSLVQEYDCQPQMEEVPDGGS